MTTRHRRSVTGAALALALALLPLQGVPLSAQGGGKIRTTSRILYHNGYVMPGHSDVYFIFYGCWQDFVTTPCSVRGGDSTTSRLLREFVMGLSGSRYFAINTTYPDYMGVTPNGGLVLGPETNDLYSHTSTLSEADVQDVVRSALLGSRLPVDPRGIYLVVGSADIYATGFCTHRTEFHDSFNLNGTLMTYGFVGNAVRCPLAYPQFTLPDGRMLPTPNGDFAADAMASSIAHVLSSIITNPGGFGWYDRYNLENSDKCQGQFGNTYVLPNGAEANTDLYGRHWLLQQNWVNSGRGYCGLSYP